MPPSYWPLHNVEAGRDPPLTMAGVFLSATRGAAVEPSKEDQGMSDTYLAALKRFSRREAANTVALRRQVAEAVIENGRYPLG